MAPCRFLGRLPDPIRSLLMLQLLYSFQVFFSRNLRSEWLAVCFDLAKEEAGVWVRIRMKRAKTSDPQKLLSEKEDPHDREIIAELQPLPQDIVFQKRRPDGFVGTDLDLILRSNGIKTLVIGGVATEGGVEGTARSARNLGYDVVVLKDGVGSRNREAHDMALKLMEQAFFDVVPAADIGAIWRQ